MSNKGGMGKTMYFLALCVNILFKYGYLKSNVTVEVPLESSNELLFHKASYDNHCLHHLLPVAKSDNYELRDIGHGLSLHHITTELHKRTFINRMIFSECY